MRGAILHAPRDIHVEQREDPRIEQPTDAVIRLAVTCVCGFSHVHLHGGPAPVRRFLPGLIELICERAIDPGRVFDLTLPLDQAAEGYRAMDERRAIKTLLRP
jgi:threonine dehydrogenase-like Zn-dependent dehydrogenase